MTESGQQPMATRGPLRRHTSHSQRRAEGVALMLAGVCDADIAARLGVRRQTVRRWRLRADVRAELSGAAGEATEAARAIVRRGARRAAERLVEMVEEPGHVGLRASELVLKLSGLNPEPPEDAVGLSDLMAMLETGGERDARSRG